jgi:proteasome accessory factor B
MVAERAMVAYCNSPYFERVHRIFDKLAERLPDKVTVKASELTDRLSMIPEPVSDIDQAVWNQVLVGLRVQKPVALHYQAPGYDELAIRIIHPYHLVGHKGEWYLLGYSDHHKEMRIYALAWVKKARLRTQDPRFEIPEEFRLDDYIDPGFGLFVNAQAYDIAIRFGPTVSSHITERRWHPQQSIEKHADRTVTMRFRSNQLEETLFWTMRWGRRRRSSNPRSSVPWRRSGSGVR